jgi:biopolymer transport protein ExbB/TolQ
MDWFAALQESRTIQCLLFLSILTFQQFFQGFFRYRQLKKQNVTSIIIDEFRNSFALLASIGSLSPFIGLFGTVIGIMDSFGEIARQGQAGFTVVSGGISEALAATAAGLIVAIVSVFFYNLLLSLAEKLAIQQQKMDAVS